MAFSQTILLRVSCGQVAETVIQRLLRIGEHTIWVGIVVAPHDVVESDSLDLVDGYVLVLEGGVTLPSPVLAGLHRIAHVESSVIVLLVGALDDVGDPADAALTQDEVEIRVAFTGA